MGETISERMARTGLNHPDWPGVLARLDDDLRLAIDRYGRRYHVQSRGSAVDGSEVWVARPGRKARTVGELLEKCPDVPGLPDALQGLPEYAVDYRDAFTDAVDEITLRFQANDWRREDYGRVICRDGNLRLVVEPNGEIYRLQRIECGAQQSNDWTTIRQGGDIAALVEYFEAQVYSVGEKEGQPPAPALHECLYSVPRYAAEGVWPALPLRPK